MWWALVTLTTVGYGDVTPVTTLGKFFSAGIMIVGVGLVALPTGLIATGFLMVHERNQARLREQAARALADGVVTPSETQSFETLAERLGIVPELAMEIFDDARPDAGEPCPHCGKPLD